MSHLLGAGYTGWVLALFNTLQIICIVLLFISSITLIIIVVMQSSADDSGNVVLGNTNESYYSKNKGKTKESKLKILTIVCASIILVCSIGLIFLLK